LRRPGREIGSFSIYGTGFGLLSGLFALLFDHAGRGIDRSDLPRRRAAADWTRTWWLSAATAVVLIAVASTSLLAAAAWLSGVTCQLIPVDIGLFAVVDRLGRRKA